MQIAVTGASGRIGNVLVRELINQGYRVRILQRRPHPALENLDLERINGDLLDASCLDRLLEGCQVVFHLAARVSIHGGHHGEVERINLDGTRMLFEAALRQGIERFIHFASIHAFAPADQAKSLDEDWPLGLHSPVAYNRSKARALHHLIEKKTPIQVIGLCPTAVIGPGDYAPSYTGQMLIKLHQGKIPLLVPGGYDWVDVRDVVAASMKAIHLKNPKQLYLLSGHYATLLQLCREIENCTGRRMPITVIPGWLVKLGLPFVAAYASLTGNEPLYTLEALQALEEGSRNISSARASNELGFHPRPLRQTLIESYQWFNQHGYLH